MPTLNSLPGGEHITIWENNSPLPSYKISDGELFKSDETLNWQTGGCMAHFKKGVLQDLPIGVRVAEIHPEDQNLVLESFVSIIL